MRATVRDNSAAFRHLPFLTKRIVTNGLADGIHAASSRCFRATNLGVPLPRNASSDMPRRSGRQAKTRLPILVVGQARGQRLDWSVIRRAAMLRHSNDRGAPAEAVSRRSRFNVETCRAGARHRRRDETAPDTEGEYEGSKACETGARNTRSGSARRGDVRIERGLAAWAAARVVDFIASMRTRDGVGRMRVVRAADESLRRLARSDSRSIRNRARKHAKDAVARDTRTWTGSIDVAGIQHGRRSCAIGSRRIAWRCGLARVSVTQIGTPASAALTRLLPH